MWNVAQKVLLLVAALPCLVIVYLFYRFGKWPLHQQQSFSQRMDYLYSFVAAALMGEFVFQALPNSTHAIIPQLNGTITSAPINSTFSSAFIFLGFFCMYCVQRFGRVWTDNDYYVAPATGNMDIHIILNPQSMQLTDYFEANDDSAEERMRITDECMELRRRRPIAGLALIILTILSVFEGFFLVYQEGNKWAILVVFFVDKVIETGIICTMMLHAFFHAPSERQYNWFLICGVWWTMVCALSVLPAVCDMSKEQATAVVTHVATNIFYAFGGGIIFWMTWYYLCIDQKRTDVRETVIRCIIFLLTGLVSWVIGYFY